MLSAMKKLFTLLTAAVAVFVSSCTYDDTALVEDLNDLRNEVENLKDQVDEQQTLLNALANQLTITSIKATSEGYVITFSDDSTITIRHGKNGADGEDGKNGADGKDSSIVNVEWDEYSVTFTLSDGTVLVLPRTETPVCEAVDLGLSVKWASFNIGATKPEEFGDYFAWGEISPKAQYIESNCLTYGKTMGDISGNPLYDAATANWGGDWRMPTKSEIQELVISGDVNWTTYNGVNGYLVTGPNGNSIFLPAAGMFSGSSSDLVGSKGYYWCSTPYDDSDTASYELGFSSEGHGWYWSLRYFGHCIRPVQDK
mgnify:CR=1 FL=1